MKTMVAKVCAILALGGTMWCGDLDAAGVVRVDLGGSWQLVKEGDSQAIPATVPGCVHTDLLAVGKIPDPFYRDNEKAVQWVGECNWIYRRTFEITPEILAFDHVLLRCEGLDTLATIRVNDAQIARTDNMFRTYEFDVKRLLQTGTNAIEIKFDSVLPWMRAKEKQRPLPTWMYPGAGYVRKEPCNFGWDWGPTLITCGIWRPIGIVAFDQARIDDVAILQDHSQKGKVTLSVEVAAAPATSAALKAKTSVWFGDQQLDAAVADLKEGRGRTALTLADPKLWWPAGMGRQPLYTVKVELARRRRQRAGFHRPSRIGLRTLRTIEQTGRCPAALRGQRRPLLRQGRQLDPRRLLCHRAHQGHPPPLRRGRRGGQHELPAVLGRRILRGRRPVRRLRRVGHLRLARLQVRLHHLSVLRRAFLDNVKQEARDNIKRLRHHPSIAVWCGNNEIMYFRDKDDQWTKTMMGEGDYYKLFRDTLGDRGPPVGAPVGLRHRLARLRRRAFLGRLARRQAVRGLSQHPRLRERVRIPVVPRAENRADVHRAGGPRVGLFARDEVPRAVEPDVLRRAGRRHDRHGQDHADREEVLSATRRISRARCG